MQELFFDLHFKFQYNSGMKTRKATGYLFYSDREKQLYLMQKSSILKSEYSDRDIKEIDRLNNLIPIKQGDIVLINGKKYSVRVLGNYSDAGRFDPIE